MVSVNPSQDGRPAYTFGAVPSARPQLSLPVLLSRSMSAYQSLVNTSLETNASLIVVGHYFTT